MTSQSLEIIYRMSEQLGRGIEEMEEDMLNTQQGKV